MVKTLYIMCGAPGSGKTTWVKEHATSGVSAHISRDRIRFEMVKETEDYFSRENEVYMEFTRQISKALSCEWVDEVYADATHLTKNSRQKLISALNLNENVIVSAVVLKPSLETCLIRNERRQGRERVPDTAITKMYNNFQSPEKDDIEYYEILDFYEGEC